MNCEEGTGNLNPFVSEMNVDDTEGFSVASAITIVIDAPGSYAVLVLTCLKSM